MADILFLRALGLMIVAAAAFLLLAKFAGIPSIVAYILAGLVVGPATGAIQLTEAIEIISETGIVLLLFLVGLELRLEKIREVGGPAVLVGGAQMAIVTAAGALLSIALGFTGAEAVFLGVAAAVSSTVVAVKLMSEKGEVDSAYGRLTVGILLVQDLIVVALLTFLAGLQGTPEIELQGTGTALARAFAGMIALMALAIASSRYLLPRVFGWISSSLEAMFIWSLAWCFLLVVVAGLFELSVELGAFIAGVGLAQLPYNHELLRRVRPLMNFAIAIFFVTLGVNIDPVSALGQIGPGLALSLLVLLAKPLIFFFLVPRVGYARKATFNIGLTLAQISEFSFIFAALCFSAGLIGERVLAVVGVMGLTTMAVSSYLIKAADRLYERLGAAHWLRLFGAASDPVHRAPPETAGHCIVVGMNSLGRRIADGLHQRGERVIAIDTDPTKLHGLRYPIVLGSADHASVLEEANIDAARLVVSALQIEDTNTLLAYRCRKLGVPCSIHAFDQSVVDELREIGANHLMIPKNNGIKRILEYLRDKGVVGV